MEILISNFDEKLKLLLESVESSEFISIDTEFTGLFHSEEDSFDESDSLEDRYQKLRKSCESFFMCQFGMSTFIKDSESNSLKIRTFTFFTLPQARDRSLCISPSSMKFLVDNNFDMNKLFKLGIPCSRLSESTSKPTRSQSSIHKLGHLSQDQVMHHVSSLLEFAGNKLQHTKDFEFSTQYQKSLLIGSSGAVRHFKNLTFSVVDSNEKSFVRVCKTEGKEIVFSPPGLMTSGVDHEQVFHDLGVSIVFACILKARKPLVVHNGLFDLGFLYSHFIDTLPETLAEFKNDVSVLFPKIFDTKTIAKCLEGKKLKRLNLEGLYMARSKEFGVDEAVRYYLDQDFRDFFEEKPHDAGYDSFITGIVFLYLKEYLKQSFCLNDAWDAVKRYENCICLNKIRKFYIKLDLNGKKNEKNSLNENIIKFELCEGVSLHAVAEIFCRFGDVFIKNVSGQEFYAKFEYLYPGSSMQSVVENLNVMKKLVILNDF
jgi:DNA polymerase III epsilon subunit-like protein